MCGERSLRRQNQTIAVGDRSLGICSNPNERLLRSSVSHNKLVSLCKRTRTMTELLEQAIAQLKTLPADEQDAIACYC